MKDLWPMIDDVWSMTKEDEARIYNLWSGFKDLSHLIWDSFLLQMFWLPQIYCLHWFGTKMLSSTKDLFSFRSYIYHMTKMDRIHIFGLNLSAVHRDLDNPNTLFKYSCISLFWKEIYISLQLNLFLRTMFVVVDFSLVTTTLKILVLTKIVQKHF